jgi:hypothetical protein
MQLRKKLLGEKGYVTTVESLAGLGGVTGSDEPAL